MSKSNKNRPGSPIKKQNSSSHQNNVSASQIQHDDYYERDLVRGLTEREVENEHLKTTIVALSEQVAVSSIP